MAEQSLIATLTAITDAQGRVSDRVDNNTATKRAIRFNVRIRSGGTGPAAAVGYKFYFHRQDDETTSHQDDGVGEVDADLSVEPDTSELAGAMLLTNDANATFQTSFVVYDPGPFWSLSFWNASGQTINATEGDHYLRYVYLD